MNRAFQLGNIRSFFLMQRSYVVEVNKRSVFLPVHSALTESCQHIKACTQCKDKHFQFFLQTKQKMPTQICHYRTTHMPTQISATPHVFPQCNIARVAEKTGEACHLSLPDVVKNKFLMFFCWLGRICDCISGTLIFQTTLIKQRGEKSERPFAL